jgi:anti-sigma factor RsiW
MGSCVMNCSDSRAALWPPEKLRLAADEVFEARKHVAGCAECWEYFEQDALILDAYHRLRTQRAPRRVRERVFDALARERAQTMGLPMAPPPSRGTRLPNTSRSLIAAAIVVMAASAGVMMFGQPAGPQIANGHFVEDYLRRAVGQDHLESGNALEVSRFVMRELGVMITPAQFAGMELSAVEVCLLDGRRGAMIKYRVDGQEISHYVVPKADSERRAPALSEYRDRSEASGPSVITWSSGRVEQALVGDLAADRLLALARRMPDYE